MACPSEWFFRMNVLDKPHMRQIQVVTTDYWRIDE
tara:strand:- start:402 stop:506 length:105 start_codon:yes stop_codon:yes gene_type:complete